MSHTDDTMDGSRVDGSASHSSTPGLVLLFGAGRPATVCVPLVQRAVELGRDHPVFSTHPDPRISRRHAHVTFDGQRFIVTDCGSRNGLTADGVAVPPNGSYELTRVLRLGDSLLAPLRDIGPLQRLGVRVQDGRVEGPTLQSVLSAIQQLARSGAVLHISGESGAGKEGLARAFHAAGPAARGPFQAVNCATIPEGVAERLLFGTKRGAYSGADADADGHVQAAHGGTLFLDEIAELSLAIQAKLLRTLETGEVIPLGTSRARKVDLRFCSATHANLRARVTAGAFREDLYYRIATPRIVAPPVRERPEEVPWLVRAATSQVAPDRAIHVSLVEACLLRPWPGNVRELLAEARNAAQTATIDGSSRVEAKHLGATAGAALLASAAVISPALATPPPPPIVTPASSPTASPTPTPTPTPTSTPVQSTPPVASRAPAPSPSPSPASAAPDPGRVQGAESPVPPTRLQLLGLLRRVDGNISAAARELGVHRTQLRRWLERQGLASPPSGVKGEPDET